MRKARDYHTPEVASFQKDVNDYNANPIHQCPCSRLGHVLAKGFCVPKGRVSAGDRRNNELYFDDPEHVPYNRWVIATKTTQTR